MKYLREFLLRTGVNILSNKGISYSGTITYFLEVSGRITVDAVKFVSGRITYFFPIFGNNFGFDGRIFTPVFLTMRYFMCL